MFPDIFDVRSIVPTLTPEERIPFIRCIEEKQRLDLSSCDLIAKALKTWAIKQEITQFRYWFQPIDCFVSAQPDSYLSWNHQSLALDELTGESLLQSHFDISSPPFKDDRSILWIPVLYFSTSGEVLDVKTPLLRSIEKIERELKRLCPKMDLTPYVEIEQPFSLVDSLQIYNFIEPISVQPLPAILFISEVEEILKRRGIHAEIKKLEDAQYIAILKKEKAHTCVDHTIQMMEIMKEVGRKLGAIPIFHDKPFSITWSFNHSIDLSALAVLKTVIHHAMLEHEDLLSLFLATQIEKEWVFRGVGNLAHPAFALCAIHAAIADSLALMLDSSGPSHLKHTVERKGQKHLYVSLLDPKTVRCYASIMNTTELLHLQSMLLERYVKQMKDIVFTIIKQFEQKIYPLLMNQELNIRLPMEQAIAMLEELDVQTRDVGIEIQAKIFSEIGVAKIEKAKLAINQLMQLFRF